MRKAKVLLIFPSSLYAPKWGQKGILKPHMASLLFFLRNNDIQVDYLDLEQAIGRPKNEEDIADFKEKTTQLIAKRDFNIAAISCWSSLNYLSSIAVAEICKKKNNKALVVVGGYHPSALPSDFIYSQSPFDFIVRKEGEEALYNICLGKIKKERIPKVILGNPTALSKDLVILSRELSKHIICRGTADIYLSKGCPFSCNFCMEPTKRCTGWSSYSVKDAIAIIRHLSIDYKVERINISDACFGFNKKWRREFLFRLIEHKMSQVFWAEGRIDLLDKDDIDLFAKLDFRIDFGTESCSEKMLYIMNKTNNPKRYLEKCKENFSYLNKKGIQHRLYLIFNHPGETFETYNETIKFLDSLVMPQKRMSGLIVGQNFFFSPGNYVYHHLREYEKRYGTIIKHKEWWKETKDQRRLAESVIASRSLMRKFGETITYWHKDIAKVIEKVIKKNKGLLAKIESGHYDIRNF